MKIFRSIGSFIHDLGIQLRDIFLYIVNPKHALLVGTIIGAILLGGYIMHLSMRFDFMLTVNNGYRCNISENSILIIIFAVFFFAIFTMFAIGQAVNIIDFKKHNRRLTGEMKWSLLFTSLFALSALIVMIIVLNKCWKASFLAFFFDFLGLFYKIWLI